MKLLYEGLPKHSGDLTITTKKFTMTPSFHNLLRSSPQKFGEFKQPRGLLRRRLWKLGIFGYTLVHDTSDVFRSKCKTQLNHDCKCIYLLQDHNRQPNRLQQRLTLETSIQKVL
jgi:hypothetical protein